MPSRRLVLLAVLLLAPSAWAAQDAGLIPTELELARADGGFAVQDSAALDGGSSQAKLLPPVLSVDSPARYPPELASTRTAGEVQLELLIDDAGEVEEARLVQGIHPLLDAAALHAAASLVFKPATLDGTPVAVRLAFLYRFTAPVDAPVRTDLALLRGLVRTKGTRAPLPGATLQVDSPKAVVESGPDGRFELRLAPGKRVVTVTAPGHKPGRFEEVARSGQALEVVYGLEPSIVNPYETIVRGERTRTEVSRITLHEQEIREVPGTMGDPFRVVMLMPGVGSVASGIAYPVVRGSEPAATGYFLDGIRIPILFHLFLGPAVIHPDFIDAIDFYPGNAPPQYGRLLGGVIEGRVTRPRDDRVHGSAYLDFINAGVFVECPFETTGTNVSVAGRLSYTPWLLGIVGSALQPPPPPGKTNPSLVLDFYDYQARVEQKLGDGRLRLLAFGSSDVFGTRIDPATSVTLSSSQQAIVFHRVDARYRTPLGAGEFEVGFTTGVDSLQLRSTNGRFDEEGMSVGGLTESVFGVDEWRYAGRLTYEVPLQSKLRLIAGLDVEHRRSTMTLKGSFDGSEIPTDVTLSAGNGTFSGGYLQLVWADVNGWTIAPGLRVDSYKLNHGPNPVAVEPRLTVRKQLTDALVVKGGMGWYHQPPTVLINLPVVDVAGLTNGLQEALHFDLGAEWRFARGLELNADIYFNPLIRTVEAPIAGDFAVGGQQNGATQQTLDSHGYAYGFEVLLRHPIGDSWFGWVSYTFQRSIRHATWDKLDPNGNVVGQRNGYVPFAFEQQHILNTVLSYKFGNNVTAGVVVHFNTGRPESGGFTSQTQVEGQTPDGVPVWVPVSRDRQDRLPPFLRVDARLAKSWAFDTFSLELYLDFLNVSLSQEVIAWNYQTEFQSPNVGGLRKEPVSLPIILPVLGVKGAY